MADGAVTGEVVTESAMIESAVVEISLTTKMQMFVELYLGEAHYNATQAARLAGYQGDANTLGATGCRLLKRPEIAAYIERRHRDAAMSADECMYHLAEIARRSDKECLKVVMNGRGDVVDATIDAMPRLRALELIGKGHKLWTDRGDHNVNVNVKAIIGIDLSKV